MLRLHIDGDWDAADFAAFFKSIDELYNYLCVTFERELYPEFGRVYAYPFRGGRPRDLRFRLDVRRIEFASPGFTDLAGLAAAMREIRELLQFVISHAASRKDRKLKREREQLEILRLKLELFEKLHSIEEEFGRPMPVGAERHLGLRSTSMPDLDPLLDAALDGRLTKAENAEEET
ncbi:MAG: hypothetical protein AAGA70_16510 [Pseudomonadota bacterium]